MIHRDDLGREIRLEREPCRIVSLVPSLTETLIDWGLRERLCGITRFCVEPKDAVKGLRRVGGTKDPDLDAILALEPDLVLVNAEENRKEDVDALERRLACWVTFPKTVDDVRDMVARLGAALGRDGQAADLVRAIDRGRAAVELPAATRAVYLVWRDPFMSVNRDTYVHDVMRCLGLVNLCAEAADRYPVITPEELRRLRPDRVILPSEPFPFGPRHVPEVAEAFCLDEDRVRLVSGEDFCWFGVRTADVFATAPAHLR